MKKFYIILFSLVLFSHCQFNIKLGETYLLPEPEKEGGMPLYEALSKRQSQREYYPKHYGVAMGQIEIMVTRQPLQLLLGSL